MSELFKTQSLLTLTAPTGIDLTDADETKILYIKPFSGDKGSWNATVVGNSLVYSFADGDIDEAGKWIFQAYVVMGEQKGYGAMKTRIFKNPLI